MCVCVCVCVLLFFFIIQSVKARAIPCPDQPPTRVIILSR